MANKKKLEVIFSPVLYRHYENSNAVVVVVDIFRATSAICNAFESGVKKMIPVPSLDEAREYKKKGYVVAAERDGIVPDFADFGNSPFNFTPERVKGKKVANSTTNGAKAIQMAGSGKLTLVSSFINISAIVDLLKEKAENVQILCAGWKGKFCLEDTLFAGALAKRLIKTGLFESDCDSLAASVDLWGLAETDPLKYIEKAMQRQRLKRLGLDDILEYCFTQDSSYSVPFFHEGVLIDYYLQKNNH